jgi:hypothetical protein
MKGQILGEFLGDGVFQREDIGILLVKAIAGKNISVAGAEQTCGDLRGAS